MNDFCNTAMSYLAVGQAYADSISSTIIQTATSQPAWVYVAAGVGVVWAYRKLKHSLVWQDRIQALRIQRKLRKASSSKPRRQVPEKHQSRSGPSNDSLADNNMVTEFKRNQESERKRMHNL